MINSDCDTQILLQLRRGIINFSTVRKSFNNMLTSPEFWKSLYVQLTNH